MSEYSDIDEEWSILETKYQGGLSTKKIDSKTDYNIRLGFDETKKMYVLVEIKDNFTDEQYIELAEGIGISKEMLEINGVSNSYFILSCTNEFRPLFSPFVHRFLKELKDSKPEKAAEKTLKKFRKYWLGKRPPLSPEEQRGLFAELMVLTEISSKNGISKSVDSWKGPKNGLHDFETENLNIEVKSTLKEPPVVRISDPEQVAPLKSKDLILIVLQLSVQDNGLSLPSLIDSVRSELSKNQTDRKYFEDLINNFGYLDVHRLYYSKKYAVDNLLICPITTDTPILNPKILSDVPATVTHITYNLHINGLKSYNPKNKDWISICEKLSI